MDINTMMAKAVPSGMDFEMMMAPNYLVVSMLRAHGRSTEAALVEDAVKTAASLYAQMESASGDESTARLWHRWQIAMGVIDETLLATGLVLSIAQMRGSDL